MIPVWKWPALRIERRLRGTVRLAVEIALCLIERVTTGQLICRPGAVARGKADQESAGPLQGACVEQDLGDVCLAGMGGCGSGSRNKRREPKR